MIVSLTADDQRVGGQTLIGEADNQPIEGLRRVALVIRNRAAWCEINDLPPHKMWWGSSVAGVCLCRYQFSCWLDGADKNRMLAMDINSGHFISRLAILEDACGDLLAPEIARDASGKLLTHYKRVGTEASWDEAVAKNGLTPVIVQDHSFVALGPSG